METPDFNWTPPALHPNLYWRPPELFGRRPQIFIGDLKIFIEALILGFKGEKVLEFPDSYTVQFISLN